MKVKILMAVAIVAGFAVASQAQMEVMKSKMNVSVYNDDLTKLPLKRSFELYTIFPDGFMSEGYVGTDQPQRVVGFKKPKTLGNDEATKDITTLINAAAVAAGINANVNYPTLVKKQPWKTSDAGKKKVSKFIIDPNALIVDDVFQYTGTIAQDFLNAVGPWTGLAFAEMGDFGFLQYYQNDATTGVATATSMSAKADKNGVYKKFAGSITYYVADNGYGQAEIGINTKANMTQEKKMSEAVQDLADDTVEAVDVVVAYLVGKKYASTWDED